MRSSVFFKKRSIFKMLFLTIGLGLSVLVTGLQTSHATCMDLADIPLDTLQQAAPGLVMFVIDDSGSMDWSIMCPPDEETNGTFNGDYYIFPDPGDNIYTSGSYYTNLEESNNGSTMMWMSQWVGYNGMYYNPDTEYTAWPGYGDADVDAPQSNPAVSGNTLDMTEMWYEWDDDGSGTIVDNSYSGFSSSGSWRWGSGGYNNNFSYSNGWGSGTVTATWTSTGLDTTVTYDVYTRWVSYYRRSSSVAYVTYDNATQVDSTTVDQTQNGDTWVKIASDVTFSTGTGTVSLSASDSQYNVCADAVKFVPKDDSAMSPIARRHYYVHNDNGTYLVNLLDGVIEYYQVTLDDATSNREKVTSDKLTKLTDTEAAAAGIVTGRTYDQEIQNFANWYSFYRRRELAAKSSIANIIDTSDSIMVGLIFINDYNNKDQRVLPVKVTLDGTYYDESSTLLNVLLNYQFSQYGTPLRGGLKKAGKFYQGSYLKPSTFLSQVSTYTYPFFKADNGGSCQQAFTILFSDGYYNSETVSVNNADGDGNTDYDGSPFGDSESDTLADVAMYYFERDLNSTLANDVPVTNVDPADHQHMVTYTIAFGVQGTLDPDSYADCAYGGTCPGSWPSTSSDTGKIDDMFHAAVNGRGKFISASNTAELNTAMEDLKNDIATRLGAAAALATNSVQLTVGSVLYQGTYNTSNWYGEVSALGLNVTTGVVGSAIWVASTNVPDWDDRTILSYTGSAGIAFEAGNLSSTQQSLLTASGLGTAEELVNFIRGDTSNNVANGGALRTRNHILGDFVHSSPVYFKDVVYIGGNDGMLHAFNAGNGQELFAYVPNLVYENLSDLADPGYTHKFYVDNTPTIVDTGELDILVCGLRKGGKGYFALNVTGSANMAADRVLWEYPNDSTGTDDDMGYSYSKAFIVYTEAEGYVVIFGNGYDSTSGEAVLYVLDAFTGALIKQLKTGVTGCNGLSTPAIVDMDLDGVVDYAFAGDLKGNMWKFDLRGSSSDDWTVAYKNGSTPMPLIKVQNTSGENQAITAPPQVMLDCVVMTEGRGLMVLFGTGQYLNSDDFDDVTVQSLYGVWDWGPMWEGKEGSLTADQAKYLGALNTDRTLTNMDSSISLLEQTVVYETTDWLVTSDTAIDYYNPVDSTGSHMGWVFDLPQSGERSLRNITLRDGVGIFVSTIPSDSPCAAGGSSVIYQLKACSGARSGDSLFDIDDDGEVTDADMIAISGDDYTVSGKKVDNILFELLEISDSAYTQNKDGDLDRENLKDNKQGMFYWRVLGQ